MLTFLLPALAFLKRIPWWAFVAVAAVLALWWLWSDDRHYRALAKSQAATIAQVKVAEKQATAAAQAARDAYEKLSKDKADAGDTHHAQIDTAATTATDRYRLDHRVCPASNSGAARQAAPAPDNRGTGVPASLPASGFVAVSDADVQACAGAVAYSISAHDWAMGLNP